MEKGKEPLLLPVTAPEAAKSSASTARAKNSVVSLKAFYIPYQKRQLRHCQSLTIIITQSFKGRFEANFEKPQ